MISDVWKYFAVVVGIFTLNIPFPMFSVFFANFPARIFYNENCDNARKSTFRMSALLCSCGDPPHHCRELPALKSLIVEFHVLPLYSAVLYCAGPTLQSFPTKGWFQRKFICSMIVKVVYRLYGGGFDVRFPCQASLQMKGPGQS